MKRKKIIVCILIALIIMIVAACRKEPLVEEEKIFNLNCDGIVADIYIDESSESEVVRIATESLVKDITAVTGNTPIKVNSQSAINAPNMIIIGTIGSSAVIDKLIVDKKINVDNVKNEWEAFAIKIIEKPFDNVEQALVIVGSDRRGTTYGIYELSEKIGVSPWYWWGDVPVEHKEEIIFMQSEIETCQKPDVKYRGIFINDEANFWEWSEVFITDDDYGQPNVATYEKVFELLLRLKANTLWPAMHGQSDAFNKVINPDSPTGASFNAEAADRYAIVMSASHCEMLLRNNETEWVPWAIENEELFNVKYPNNWKDAYDYSLNPEAMNIYWEQRVAENYLFENAYTIGLRGVHDSDVPYKAKLFPTDADKARLIKSAIAAQLEILEKYENLYKEETGKDIKFTKIFCPYKEVGTLFNKLDLGVPDDAILVWADDNFGYVRQYANDTQLEKYSGGGVYYHASYLGPPLSYLWLGTTPMPLMYQEMNKAYHAGSKDFWIINVGDIKPSEMQIEFFLQMGWDINKYHRENVSQFYAEIGKRDFNLDESQSADFAIVMEEYYNIIYAKKPEFYGKHIDSEGISKWGEYSSVTFGDEAQRLINTMQGINSRSANIYQGLGEDYKDAYYQRIHYMLLSSKLTMEKNIYQQKNQLYALQGRFDSVNAYANASKEAYAGIINELAYYNSILADGKWNQIMNPYQRRYARIEGPPSPLEWRYADQAQTGIGSVCEGQVFGHENITLMFNSISNDVKFIDIFNKGYGESAFTITTSKAIILLNSEGNPLVAVESGNELIYSGEVTMDMRLWVQIDWTIAVSGEQSLSIIVEDDHGFSKQYNVLAEKYSVNPAAETLAGRVGYYETNGIVSIEAEHYTANVAKDEKEWRIVKGLGISGDSMKAYPDASSKSARIDPIFASTAPYLEYKIYFGTIGDYDGTFYRIPTLNEGKNNIGLNRTNRTMWQLNDGAVQTLHGNTQSAFWHDGRWDYTVIHNNEKLAFTLNIPSVGWHTLRIYMSDGGIAFDKITLYHTYAENTYSYLGAPETYNTINDNYVGWGITRTPDFISSGEVQATENKLYMYDFGAVGEIAASGYKKIDNVTQESIEQGYSWDEATFANVMAMTTEQDKVSVLDCGFVYGNLPSALTISLNEMGTYIVALYIGDRNSQGITVADMSISANGNIVLSGINVATGSTIIKYFIVEIGEEKSLRLDIDGNNWLINGLEMVKYTEGAKTSGTGAFIADQYGNINIEAETCLEDSEYAYITPSTDGGEWTEVLGSSGTAMFAGPNADKQHQASNSSKLNYVIDFAEAGQYNIWLLVKSHSPNDDSVFVFVDGVSTGILNDTNNTGGVFKWFTISAKLTITESGEHTISIGMREDGIIVDKIIINKLTIPPVEQGGIMHRTILELD